MMDFILVPLVVGIVTLGVYKLFELFVRKKERLMLIEKFGDRLDLGDLKERFSIPLSPIRFNFSFSSLKGGCLMLGIGLGLLIAFFICCYAFPNYVVGGDRAWEIQSQASVVYGSCVLLFGGIGLISAFLIEMHIHNKNKKE